MADEKSPLPSWKAVKAALQSFDRAGLLGLVHDLYAVDKGNKAFLHARLGAIDIQDSRGVICVIHRSPAFGELEAIDGEAIRADRRAVAADFRLSAGQSGRSGSDRGG